MKRGGKCGVFTPQRSRDMSRTQSESPSALSYLMEVISRFEDGIMHSSDVATKRRRVLTCKVDESQELVLVQLQHSASCPVGASNVIS